MSSEQSVIAPTAPSHSATRREKKQAERLARAQAVTQQTVPHTKSLTVFAGDPGTYTDPDPMNTAGWTTIRRGKGY